MGQVSIHIRAYNIFVLVHQALFETVKHVDKTTGTESILSHVIVF